MNIQTLSIVVPTKGCVNNCLYCVSKTHSNDYQNRFIVDSQEFILFKSDLRRRLEYAKLHKVDTIILTGTGEALQNKPFLMFLNTILEEMGNPFPRIEIQTSGVMLDDINLHILRQMGVSTISISISDIFNDDSNLHIMGANPKLYFNLDELCKKIKSFGFNIRLSLNMTSVYNDVSSPSEFFKRFKELGANQITFREMYSSDNNTKEDQWIKEHTINYRIMEELKFHIKDQGKPNYILPFGATVYSIHGMSAVVDNDCMDTKTKHDNTLKYLILREDGKLYCKWDDEGSLIF
jgi:molybdenum cofactor biosynthesis enzyme MoaA